MGQVRTCVYDSALFAEKNCKEAPDMKDIGFKRRTPFRKWLYPFLTVRITKEGKNGKYALVTIKPFTRVLLLLVCFPAVIYTFFADGFTGVVDGLKDCWHEEYTSYVRNTEED